MSRSNRIGSEDIQIGESYVLPIEQSTVSLSQAKVKQILEEANVKAQQILYEAENKSEIIVQTANTEATRIIEEARTKALKEYDEIKEQAHKEGFKKGEEDGLQKFREDAIEGINSLETLTSTNFDLKKNIIDSATKDIVELITIIANKVCHMRLDTRVLYAITCEAIKLLNDKENITIIVSPKLVEHISKLVPNFKSEFQNIKTLKILEDNSLSADGVIVETPDTRLDSRISSQIAEITRKMLTDGNNMG